MIQLLICHVTNEEYIYLLQSLLTGKSPVGLEQRNPSEFGAVLHVCEVAVIVLDRYFGDQGQEIHEDFKTRGLYRPLVDIGCEIDSTALFFCQP